VTDRINLTPVALMEGMALARTIVKGEPTKPDYDFVASAVFSWPNIATVVRGPPAFAARGRRPAAGGGGVWGLGGGGLGALAL
jgi:glutathione reductase (NADPH)